MGKSLVLALIFLMLTGCNLTSNAPDGSNNENVLNNPNAIQYYALLPGDNGLRGTSVSCEDSAVGISTGQEWSTDMVRNLGVALRGLMTTEAPTLDGQLFTNYWAGRSINVDSVQVSGDAVTIELSSAQPEILLSGVCYDGALQSQLLLTVFQNQAVSTAYITYNDQNLKQLFDASGLVTADESYTRTEANRGANTNPDITPPATNDPRTPMSTTVP